MDQTRAMERLAGKLPNVGGAYLLIIELDAEISIRLGARPESRLPPGCYGYCGSARGPGGIGARVRRHLRKGKRPHWHVDRLTEAGRIVGLRSLPGGSECRLVRDLLKLPGVTTPVLGFGSSDCRLCPAHLVSFGSGIGVRWSEGRNWVATRNG